MTKQVIFTDPLGTKLYWNKDVDYPEAQYTSVYPVEESEEENGDVDVDLIGEEDLPFQNGSPTEYGVNGVTNELLIYAVKHRIEQSNKHIPSPYNKLAILLLDYSLKALNLRSEERKLTALIDTEQDIDKLRAADRNAVEVLRFNQLADLISSFADKFNTFSKDITAERSQLKPVSVARMTIPALKKIFQAKK